MRLLRNRAQTHYLAKRPARSYAKERLISSGLGSGKAEVPLPTRGPGDAISTCESDSWKKKSAPRQSKLA